MKNANLARHGNQKTTTKLFALMKDGKPRTINIAAREVGLTDAPVYLAAKKLREWNDLRICSWDMSPINNRFIAVWQIGSAPDAPRPPREEWVRPKHDELEHVRRIAEELARPAFRHWQDTALFGEARPR